MGMNIYRNLIDEWHTARTTTITSLSVKFTPLGLNAVGCAWSEKRTHTPKEMKEYSKVAGNKKWTARH